MTHVPYKVRYSFEQRISESTKIRQKFPGRVPVIVERSQRSESIPMIDKEKFLVPGDLTVGQFIFVVRKRLSLPSETALFIFVNGTLPTTGTFLRELYETLRDSDGFLYANYAGENTFGAYCGGNRRGHIHECILSSPFVIYPTHIPSLPPITSSNQWHLHHISGIP